MNDEERENKGAAEMQRKTQAAILSCIETLNISDNVDDALNRILEILAGHYAADRSYIFEFSDDGVHMNNTYEWCAEGVEPEMDNLQGYEISAIDRWMRFFEEKGEFYINSLEKETDKNSEEYRVLAMQGIESLVAAPIILDGKITGFIGADNPRENTEDLLLLKSASAFVVNDICKRITMEEKVIRSISDTYMSMRLINLKENTQHEYSTNGLIKKFVKTSFNAEEQILDAVRNLVEKDYEKETVDFFRFSKVNERLEGVRSVSCEFPIKTEHWCRATFIAVSRDENGCVDRYIQAIKYIDKEKERELEYQRKLKKAVENQNEIYAEMLHMQGCGLIAANADTGKVIMINDSALEMLGMDRSDDIYKKVFAKMNVEEDKRGQVIETFRRVMHNLEDYSYEFSIMRDDGKLIYLMSEVRGAVLSGGERVMINSLMDITDKKKLEQELIILSETDFLTHISNRRSGEAQIERLLSDGQSGMYCLLDVDKFKSINDTYGHTVGDKALVAVADCLKKSFRSSDVIMRLGGDEFAVFVVGIETEEQGILNIKRLIKAVEKIDIPEMGEDKLAVSLGAVLCREGAEEYEKLYAKADSAMYVCKSQKGNYYSFCKEGWNDI